MNAIIFFMNKRVLSIVLVIIISFIAFVSSPASVYAATGGYSWEDYYDLDSNGNYTLNDDFYNLSMKGKIYVILDTFQNADDKVSTEYLMEDDTAVNVLSYIAWSVLSAVGVCAIPITATKLSASIVSTFINLLDSGDITVTSDSINVSSDAVNEIRQAYVDQYRIVEIDDYNVFSFGTVFNTDAVYSDSTTVYTENIDTYAYRWNTLTADGSGNEFVCVPVVYSSNELYYGYEYAASSLKFYIAKNGNTAGKWHIARYCDGSLGSSSVSGRLYYDADSVQTSAEIVDRYSLSNSAPATIYFIQDTNEADSLPYASETGYIGYDSSTGYYYWSVNNPVYRISDVNFISRLLAFGSFDTSYAPAYYPGDAQATVSYVPYVSYMDPYFYEGYEQNKAKIVQLSMDSVLVDDISGTTYTYNSYGGGYYVSSDAIDDATDDDDSNSPSKVINYNTVVYVVNHYDDIIEEITEDNSVTNVTVVVNNYYESDTVYDYDYYDDDGTGGAGGSDDGSDDSSIIAWLIKIYNKLCEFFTDAMNILSSIRTSLVSLKTYAYMMAEDISDLNSLVDSLPNYNTTLQPISEQAAAIRTMVVSVNTNLNNGLDELYGLLDTVHTDLSGLLDTVHTDLSDLYSLVDELPDYSTTLSPISQNVASIKTFAVTINTNLNDGLGNLYDLVASLPDYSSVLSTVSSTVSSINTSVSSLVTKLNSALDYLDGLSDGVTLISTDLHSFINNYSGGSGESSGSGSSSGSSDYSTVLNDIYNMVTANERNTEDIIDRISSIESVVYLMQEALNAVRTDLSGLYSLVCALPDYSTTLSVLSSDVSTLKTSVSTVNTKLNTALDYLLAISDDVALLATDFHSFNGKYSSGSGSSSGSSDYSTVLDDIYNMVTANELNTEDIIDRLSALDFLSPIYDYMVGFYEILPNINNFVVDLYNEVCALPESIADLFAEYFMDTYYVSQTVFEIIRGDLDMIYEILYGDMFTVLTTAGDDLSEVVSILSALQENGLGDVNVDLSGIKGHLSAIEVLLTGIAAILAVDTLTDLADFADDQLDEYLDDITDSLSEVGDAMTDVFPFCIPWDMLTIFALFAAAPEAPVFEIPFEFDRLGISYTMKVDFSEYEQAALICRTILTCVFVVGLGYLTIRITNGGGGGGEED